MSEAKLDPLLQAALNRLVDIGPTWNTDQRDEWCAMFTGLVGVIEGVCEQYDVPFFSCRGYTSQSEMWVASQRLRRYVRQDNQTPIILHLGDHDPSGIDMTRDITDRIEMFSGGVDVKRLALNMDQVDEYNPPPNPAKTTDSRFIGYRRIHGDESWELDALEPQVISDLIEAAILEHRDEAIYARVKAEEDEHKALLKACSERWNEVAEMLEVG